MRRFSLALIAVALAAAFVAFPSTGEAKPKKPKKGEAAEAKKPDAPYEDWNKVTKDATAMNGFLTLHRKRDKLYLEVPPQQLDTPLLAVWSLARGIGKDMAFGGSTYGFDERVIEFHRVDDQLQVVEQNMRFVAPAGTAVERARDLSFGNSVLASLKIESVHDSSKAVLVNITPFLVSDIANFSGYYAAFNPDEKPLRFDEKRSALTTAKVFPENAEIEAILTYTPGDPTSNSFNTVPDARYIPITMHYSFSKLPEQPMLPRLADDRTGYFLHAVKDFSLDTEEHFWRRFVTRWRLEKKDPSAAVSEPVKPIVFYVDHTVPEKYRDYIKEGIEAWQPAFEAAGFKNAILAKDPPADDPDWDPADVRYSTIRWITTSVPSYGAIGPSRIDPRTGEILDADILFDAVIVQSRWSVYNNMVGPGAVYEMPWMRDHGNDPLHLRCEAALEAPMGLAMMQMAAMMDGTAEPGSPVQERFVREMLVQVVLHEVGHSLGLTHNFRSSTDTPADKLHDPEWTKAHGITSSVMDYATPNIARDRSAQGQYYTSGPGTCDTWMIRYGYTPSGATDTDADYAFVKKIADESTLPGHAYSPDPDTYGPYALDPRSNIRDLGDDPLAFAKERSDWLTSILNDEGFDTRILGAEGEYPKLRRAVDGLLGLKAQSLGFAVKYIGGQYQSRNHHGQPGAVDPLQPVPAARQREALAFLSQRAFAADAFALSPSLLNRLAPDRWNHWGASDPAGSYTGPRLDYNLGDKVVGIQKGILNALTAPGLLGRLREAESRSADAYALADYMRELTDALWGEVGSSVPARIRTLSGPHTRRELQRAYVDKLAEMMVAPPPGLPDDARALARLHLSRIDGRASTALRGETPLGDDVRAHLIEARARIKRANEAGRQADMAGGRGGHGGHAVSAND